MPLRREISCPSEDGRCEGRASKCSSSAEHLCPLFFEEMVVVSFDCFVVDVVVVNREQSTKL
jgi:hypothetical protein